MSLKLIDAHAHLNFANYDEDRDEVIKRTREAGIGVISVGTNLETSKQALALAEQNENMWATIGLHPTDFTENFDYAKYLELAKSEKVVAIGECGLDYFRQKSEAEQAKQKEVFIKQIELANQVGKPLMLHIRDARPTELSFGRAYQDAYKILKKDAKVKGNTHFFAGTWDEARLFLDLGFTLSFTGVITFARDYDEVIRHAPLNQILIETDCPFVAPVPHRGKRNEPSYAIAVVEKIAEIKGVSIPEVEQITLGNTIRLFGL